LDGPTGDASAHGRRRRAHPDERGVIRSAFHLLDLVADLEPVRLVDLALVAGIPRPTVHRLLGQLVAVGAVRREGTRYRLGQSLLGLGTRVSPERQLRVAARRPIAELAAASGATVSLSGALGGDLVYLDTVDARVPFGYIFEPGSQVPQGTAQARAHTEIPHEGPLAAIVDEGRVVPDLSCVAAPIPLPTGGVAAIAAVVAGRRPPAALVGATRATAARIAGLLNDQPDLGAAKSSLDGLSVAYDPAGFYRRNTWPPPLSMWRARVLATAASRPPSWPGRTALRIGSTRGCHASFTWRRVEMAFAHRW
jgi:DNA-binding IclR family transcriptional regulator